jgi:hypothetical protein
VLAVTVGVRDPDSGDARIYLAGDTVPDEWARHISNPNVWVGEDGSLPDGAPVPGPSQSVLWSDSPVVSQAG